MFFIANWKMFGDLKSVNSIKKVIKLSKNKKFNKAQIIYCPPYTLISNFVKLVKNSKIKIGAQNCHQSQNPGPFTGSINTELIKSSGANYVIIGHSENRTTGDTNRIINLKIKAALKKNLKIIFCIGETLEQRQNNLIKVTLKEQLTKGLNGIRGENIILAYEPVWAIGTGETATSAIIVEAHCMIRNILNDIGFDGEKISILYGGSVNRNNAKELIELEGVDGFLIGGASLDAEHFYDIYKFIEESI